MNRNQFLSAFIIGCFLFLLAGLLNTELRQGKKYKELSLKNCIRLLPQQGARGKIFDRDGASIIDNKISYDLMLMPQDSQEHERTLEAVSNILNISSKDLRRIFRANYLSISVPVTVAKNVSRQKAIALEEIRIDFPGIIIQPNPARSYPYASLACHLAGYVSEIDRWRLTKLEDYGYKTKDIVGFGGLEEKYDYYLRQEEGGVSMEVDHRGRFVRLVGFQPPKNGMDIQLTLSLPIQKIVEKHLEGRNGSVVIMDPDTGEILAMASFPNFNPALFVDKEIASFDSLFNDPDSPFIDRVIGSSYPAGSVFKPVVATAALEIKKINPSTTYLCQGSVTIGKQKFGCWETHHEQNLLGAIAHSCNVYFYKIGLLLGGQALHDYASRFGFGRTTSIELPYETSGFLPSPLWRKLNKFKNWYDGDTANLSIGQGDLLVTPLQVVRMMASFANHGSLVIPNIIKSVGGTEVVNRQKRIIHLPFKKGTIDYVREGLRQVVSSPAGTASVLSSLPVAVAGKTGTAQTARGISHAWFSGFFPFANPRYAICVFLEHGGPGYAACLVTKQIIEDMISQGLV